MLKLELRPQASRTMTFVAPLLAIAATVLVIRHLLPL